MKLEKIKCERCRKKQLVLNNNKIICNFCGNRQELKTDNNIFSGVFK